MSDPFAVLGLTPDASPVEVRSAYRNLARSNHPDAGGSVEKFTAIARAMGEALSLARRAPCPDCNGKGKVTRAVGWQPVVTVCVLCEGTGLRHKNTIA